MAYLTVVVIDDEENVRTYAEKLLQKAGYETRPFESGDAAMPYIVDGDYDAVLTDLKMPGSADGLAILEAVKNRAHIRAVIIMTGYASIDSAVQAMRMGADDYLCKPFQSEELLLRLEKVGRDKEQRELLDGTEANKAQAMHDLQMMVAKLQYKFNRLDQALANKNLDLDKRVAKARDILAS